MRRVNSDRRVLFFLVAVQLCLAFAMSCSCSGDDGGNGQDAATTGGQGGGLIDGSGDGGPDGPPPDSTVVDVADVDGSNGQYAWLFDPSAWKPYSGVPGCDLRVAHLGVVKRPGHTWASCGVGCSSADVFPGPQLPFKGATRYGTAARAEGGDIHVFINAAGRFPPAVQLLEGFLLGSDSATSLIGLFGDDCEAAFGGATSSRIFRIARYDPSPDEWLGIAPLTAADAVLWPLPPVQGEVVFFDFLGGWGWIRNQGNFEVTFQPSTTKLQTIASTPPPQVNPRASTDAVVWSDGSAGNTVVKAWTSKGGARTIVAGPWNAVNPSISESRVVWVRLPAGASSYQGALLCWADRKLDPDQIILGGTLSIPLTQTPGLVTTHGKWVALRQESSSLPEQGILLANLESKELWRVPQKPGAVTSVLAVSDTDLLIASSESSEQPETYFQTLLRYDLAQLSAYATKLQ